jgi:S-adenosylmethionine:tRNA ribosyltransferase-isomerase
MKTADFNYHLPPGYIAQVPVEPRHASRLMVVRRDRVEFEHATFWDLDKFLSKGDLLVVNRTKVIPARVFGKKPTGGKVEILLLSKVDDLTWRAWVGGKRMVAGKTIAIPNGPQARIAAELEGAERQIIFNKPIEPYLSTIGNMPLPPYIHTHLEDPDRYQTIYAREMGSVAAPTAGLHFTAELMSKVRKASIQYTEVLLHVGLDTFAPVTESDPTRHRIHTEWCSLPENAAKMINETKRGGKRVVAVGTTSVRTLETAARSARKGDAVEPFTGNTDLFILPGYEFKVVDAMVTNFHLPRSTLLMLVSAFAGKDRILAAYREAMAKRYRFYSFGDAMLIL